MKTVFLFGAGLLAMLGALGFVGADDYRAEVLQAVQYCDNVQAGLWPDFDDVAKHCPAVYAEARAVFGIDF